MKHYNWKGRTIVIAEDVDINYRLLQLMLRKTEADLIRAKNGQEVVNILQKRLEEKQPVDMVLMDVQMPIKNGYEATTAIREITTGIPIIAQTAFDIPGEREKSLEAGCNGYITKPIDKQLLLDTIEQYFDK